MLFIRIECHIACMFFQTCQLSRLTPQNGHYQSGASAGGFPKNQQAPAASLTTLPQCGAEDVCFKPQHKKNVVFKFDFLTLFGSHKDIFY